MLETSHRLSMLESVGNRCVRRGGADPPPPPQTRICRCRYFPDSSLHFFYRLITGYLTGGKNAQIWLRGGPCVSPRPLLTTSTRLSFMVLFTEIKHRRVGTRLLCVVLSAGPRCVPDSLVSGCREDFQCPEFRCGILFFLLSAGE